MKKILCYSLIGLALFTAPAAGQDYLVPAKGYKAGLLFPDKYTFGPFDLADSLIYVSDGDTIRSLNLYTGEEVMKYAKPGGYASYASFITIAPGSEEIWAGFTVFGGTDDRIYRIGIENGVWELQARMPGNFDLEFWNGSILVSGLNSTNWEDPNLIVLLDTSGLDKHRTIAVTGGYSAGLAIDDRGNLCYGTSFASGQNGLFRWDSSEISSQLHAFGADTLKIEDADKLTDLPSGANDVEVDDAGNLLFNCNDFMFPKLIALWNGKEGDGMNFDTLAVAEGEYVWLGMLKSQGTINLPGEGNRLITISIGFPLTEILPDFTQAYTPIGTVGDNCREIDLFPNPNGGRFVIRANDPSEFTVKVYNLAGTLVYENTHYVQGHQIDISNQPAGSYIIRITDAEKITSGIIHKL